MELREKLKILDLSLKEQKVLIATQKGKNTPLLISQSTKVSRPAVYEILKKLKKRGIVATHIVAGKKYWGLARLEDIDQAIYEAKRVLLSISEGTEEVSGLSDGLVIIHRGKEAVHNLIMRMLERSKTHRLVAIQGNYVQDGWDKIVGQKDINRFNTYIQKHGIITQGVLPYEWYEDHVRDLGIKDGLEWIDGFTDRPAMISEIPKEYFNHAGQIFIVDDTLYLMAMNEELVIEIKHSEIKKLIHAMMNYIADTASKVDLGGKVRRIVASLESGKMV